MTEGADRGGRQSPGNDDARIQLLLAEYVWVAGLVRYYREVELKALAGTGIVLSAVAAAYAALEGGSAEAAEAEGVLMAAAACVPAFIVPIVVMANMRGMRAVLYVQEWLQPLAVELSGDRRYLAWEHVAQPIFLALGDPVTRGLGARLISAAPVVALVASTSIALAVGAWTIHPTDASRAVGTVAGVIAAAFAVAGLRLAAASERRGHLSAESRERIIAAAR